MTVLKWKDKRYLLLLSTKHSAGMETIQKKYSSCERLEMAVEYDSEKS